jgi:hypothetical protein
LQALFNVAVVYQPAGRFGKEKDEQGEDACGDYLDSKGNSPLLA